MSDIDITYKGASIATMSASGTKTLLTSGKYCEDDIEIDYTRPEVGGDGTTWQDGSGYVHLSDEAGSSVTVDSLTITNGGTYTAPTGHAYSPVTVASGVVTAPSTISGTSATVSSGTNTLTLSKTVSVTPSVTTNGYVTSGTAGNSSVSLTASVNTRSSSDLTASGATVTAPSGYYASSATKTVASGTAGTPTATKGAVNNHSISVTPSVTNTTGYITGSTINGTAVSVSASELVSGTKSITSNGTNIDVTEYAAVDVAVSGGGGGATQHTIHLEFSDSTDTDIDVYYDDSLLGTMITAYEPSSWTYSGKTVTLAQLDNVTWYDKQSIPIGVELIDYTALSANTSIDGDGDAYTEQYYYATDYTAVESGMVFSYKAGTWTRLGLYDSNKTCISVVEVWNDGTDAGNNTSTGTLSGSKLPSNVAYARIASPGNNSSYMSLIRTA